VPFEVDEGRETPLLERKDAKYNKARNKHTLDRGNQRKVIKGGTESHQIGKF